MEIDRKELRKDYLEHRAQSTIHVGRIVSIVFSIIMVYAVHLDIYVLAYPKEIVIWRIITTASYLLFFTLCFTKVKHNQKVIIGLYTWCITSTMILGVWLNIRMFGVNRGVYNTRIIQVIFLFIIGTAIFAEGARIYMPYIMSCTMGIMILFFIFYRDLSIEEWALYFNVIAAAVLAVINAKIYEKKNYEKFVMEKEMSITLEKLRSEIELRKEIEKKLEKKAFTDELTGILNRRAGIQILRNEFEIAKENNKPLSICYIDLNNLKEVNDSYGHSYGDEYILCAVDIIKKEIREEDIFLRLGGDEFLVIFVNTTYEEIKKIWNRIKEKCRSSCTENSILCSVSASHGIETFYNNNFSNVEEFMESADKKMYEEKEKYRKR